MVPTHSPLEMPVARARAGTFEVQSEPAESPGPGEVRVRLRACGVCGSDLHFYHAGLFPPGRTPGHEMFGEVDALGPGVDGFRVGDAVAIEPLHSCGHCKRCLAGLDALCREAEIYGVHRDGGFAGYRNLPARRVFRAPGDLEPAVGALTEPMAVVVHGLRRGRLEPGQRVLVLGAGSVGLVAALAARAMGAEEVILTARHAHQAELGAKLGADRVLREDEAGLVELDALGRERDIDLVVETVGGSADTLDSASAAVRPGGTVCVLGVFLTPMTTNPLPYFMKEVTVAWSNCYAHPHEDSDFEAALGLVSEHRRALADLNTHTLPLAEIDRAFALASDKKSGAVKVTVEP